MLQNSIEREAQKLTAAYYAKCDRHFAAKQEQLSASYEQKLADKDAELAAAEQRHEADEQEKTGLQARVHALEYRVGQTPTEDTTSREYNAQLEREYVWFNNMFDENWKKTKRRIRKEILWSNKKSKDNDQR